MRVSSTKSRYYQSWSRWRYCDFCHMVGAKTPLLQHDHTLANYIKAPIMKLVLSDYQSKQLSALSGFQFPWFNCLSTKISNFDRSDDYLRAAVLTNSVPLTASILFISLCWFTYIGALLGDQINCMIKNFFIAYYSLAERPQVPTVPMDMNAGYQANIHEGFTQVQANIWDLFSASWCSDGEETSRKPGQPVSYLRAKRCGNRHDDRNT
jgi:transposase